MYYFDKNLYLILTMHINFALTIKDLLRNKLIKLN